MKNDKIIIIKGRKYYSSTGLPVPDKPSAPDAPSSLHSISQKPQMVMAMAKKPISQGAAFVRKVGQSMDIARSKSISHFSSRPLANTQQPAIKKPADIGPTNHPLISKVEKARADAIRMSPKQKTAKTTQQLKAEAIAEAYKRLDDKPEAADKPLRKKYKIMNITTASICLLVIIGYFIYLYLPSFSVRVASLQSGINASYPEYCPDGYSLNGPVTYKDGEVTINFHANTGHSEFIIKQSKSSWDSSAVKAAVEESSKAEISTTSERGLTIFSNDNVAMWVNGGILYSITGNAPLSSDQIRRIATSL